MTLKESIKNRKPYARGYEWTSDEVKTLFECVKQAHTKTEGFTVAAKMMSRSPETCSQKYYEILRRKRSGAAQRISVKKTAKPALSTNLRDLSVSDLSLLKNQLEQAMSDLDGEVARRMDEFAEFRRMFKSA